MVNEYTLELDAETRHPVLIKEASYEYDDIRYNSPEKIVGMMNSVFKLDVKSEEYVYLLCLNTKADLLSVSQISHGTVNQTILNPREVMQRALLSSAVTMVIIHNHPSKDKTPSKQDDACAERMKKATKIMGINLVDFIIIAGDDFYSYATEKRL